MRNEHDVASLMSGSNCFDDSHRAGSYVKCRFSSRRTATRDISSPVFEGLRPPHLDLVVLESFPLAIVHLFQPIFDHYLNARESAQSVGSLTSTQHGAAVDGIPVQGRV